MINIKKTFTYVFILSLIIFLVHYFIVGKGVYGDGVYYYSIVRSVVIDKDLNFRNELEYFGRQIITTPKGLTANKFPIGTSLLWLPFFSLANLIVKTFSFISNGYTDGYQLITGIGCLIYSSLGLYLCFKMLRNYFTVKTSLTAVLIVWLASNLFFYTSLDVLNSHSGSFFISSLLVYAWIRSREEKKKINYIILGLLTALLALIRLQDIIFGLPIILDFFLSKSRRWFSLIGYLIGLILGLIPQFIIWNYLYGSFINPYFLAGESFNWFDPKIMDVLFSRTNGLLIYSPILILSLFGLYKLYNKYVWLGLLSIIVFVLQLYIVASWHMWWGGASYGNRMFISFMPYFMLGMANIIAGLKKNYLNLFYCFSMFIIILNFYNIFNFLKTN